MIDKMKIRGARVHNLKNIDVDIPLNKIVGIAGGRIQAVSGRPLHLHKAQDDPGGQSRCG